LIHTPVCMGLIQFIAEKKQFIKFWFATFVHWINFDS
jgi:hypothetical protein